MGHTKKLKIILVSILAVFLMTDATLMAQPTPNALLKESWFWPDYTLDRNAKNQIGPKVSSPSIKASPLKPQVYSFEFFGQHPSERLEDYYPVDSLPASSFSIEMWMLYHVNNEVGIFTGLRHKYEETDPDWLLGLFDREIIFTLKTENSDFANVLSYEMDQKGWKYYWIHVVATYENGIMSLYVDGELKKQMTVGDRKTTPSNAMQLETASYLSNEPYMQMGDLLKCQRIYSEALSPKEIKKNLKSFKSLVHKGKLYDDLFHFNAGPYLQMAKPGEMGLVWETSHPAHTVISYGTSLPLQEEAVLETMPKNQATDAKEGGCINKHVLKNLEEDQPYFYNIKSTSEEGNVIESGISTFKSMPKDPQSFTFSVIGDTEARPHVNNRLAKLLWDERPEFLINLGDLTDGGKEGFKFQWNYEYFYAMSQLTSRIPVYPVAGNGEGDLFWFNKYHILPYKDKAYYKFSFGEADFFMLDSNQKEELSPGGEQYRWLENQLKTSTATWKFVSHHHAPYSSDENDYGDSWKGSSSLGDPEIKAIVPLYEKYEVDLVMFGHLHTYQRTHKIKDDQVTNSKGVTYVQAGGAGGNLEDFAPTRSWFSAKTFRGHHYLTIEVFDQRLEMRMYDSEGRMKDLFSLEK